MINGMLPIGTVVILNESKKRVMIVGVAQRGENQDKIWDYCGVVFPEGYMSADKLFLFDNEQIERVYHVGLLDSESIEFKDKLEKALESLKAE